jgi:outer membrane protein
VELLQNAAAMALRGGHADVQQVGDIAIALAAANRRLSDLQQQVRHDVRSAWLTASNAYQRIPVTVELLGQARLALELAQGRDNLGLASIVEVTQAELSVTKAQIENVNANCDYRNSWAALQYTLGALR